MFLNGVSVAALTASLLASAVSTAAILDYDFRNNTYYGPDIVVNRASSAYIDDGAGNWTLVPANTLRRSDKGVLVEGAQTNSIRNNAITSNTTPGTWAVASLPGVTRTLTAQTRNGIDGLLISFVGTTTASNNFTFQFDGATSIAAASGDLWSGSLFIQVDNNPGNIGIVHTVSERDSAGAQVSGAVTNTTLSNGSVFQRLITSRTLTGSTTAFVFNRITSDTVASGVSVNLQFWIGWPQLEKWSTSVTTAGGASSPIRTTGTAATRAADVVTATLGSALSTMTVAGVVQPIISTLFGGIVRLGTTSDRIDIRSGSVTPTTFQVQPVVGGSAQAQLNAAANTLVPMVRTGFAYAGTTGDQAASIAGAAVVANAPVSLPMASALVIGGGGNQFNGYIERLLIYPYRATNTDLQKFSSLATYDTQRVFPMWASVADYDFRNDVYSGPAISVSRASAAYVDDSAGNWTLVPPNTLRRSDKGALIEGAQTNSLRTSAIGTGAFPGTWASANPTGSTRSVQAQTRNGIDGLLITYTGTLTASSGFNISFETATTIAAASGQLWSSSFFLQVDSNVGGATFNNEITERDAAGSQVSGALTSTSLSPTGSLQRFVTSRTLTGSTTAFVYNRLVSPAIPAGTAINLAIWVGWPQLEQWSPSVTTVGGASSPIRTTGAAATRAADVVTATLAQAPSSGSFAGVYQQYVQPAVTNATLIRLGTASERFEVRTTSNLLDQLVAYTGNSVTGIAGTAANSNATNVRHGFAAAFAASDLAISIDGTSVGTSAPASITSGQTTFQIGGGTGFMFGYIERLTVLPYRASNNDLQRLSTLAA